MKKILLLLVVCVAALGERRPHPKLLKSLEEYDIPLLKKVPCTSEQHRERSALMQQARCGAPREVFVELKPRAAYEQIIPKAVWVRRCVGLCDHEGADSKCVPLETTVRNIPVKVFNVKTRKESCSVYPVEEHASCGCCAGAAAGAGCAAPRVFNPRKCACQCPDAAQRRACHAQRRTMRWISSKCICETRKRPRGT